MKTIITPEILYWGTPIVLITTENEDSTPNIAPMSSAWWLADRCMLGLDSTSQTTKNLLRTKQCVLNLASDNMAHYINALARTTGTPDVPPTKLSKGYRYVKDKFSCSGLTPIPSRTVRPPCIEECPVQMEAELMNVVEMMQDAPDVKGAVVALEVKIIQTRVDEELRLEGHENRIDPDKWRPMIFCFREMYGLQSQKAAKSKQAEIQEERDRAVVQ